MLDEFMSLVDFETLISQHNEKDPVDSIKMNQQLVYRGVLDNCNGVGITKTELQEAQAPLNPSIRRPKMEDWKRKRKYFGNLPTDIVQRLFKHTT